LRGGTRLSSNELALLQAVVEHLPPGLRETVESQFEQYNLAQRESDGRALNFYRVGLAAAHPLPVSPSLPFDHEAPLLRVSAVLAGDSEPLHAVLTAVLGRAFCLTFDRPVPSPPAEVRVTRVIDSWRSALHAPARDE
jgi:hypothetical protein